MVQINFAKRQINLKIVYCGPPHAGRSTTLHALRNSLPELHDHEILAQSPYEPNDYNFTARLFGMDSLAGMDTRLAIHSLPHDSYYSATRRLTLQGTDALIFIGSSLFQRKDSNRRELTSIRVDMQEVGLAPDTPLVFQWNKRDLPSAQSVEWLNQWIGLRYEPFFESIALTGEGLAQALYKATDMVFQSLCKDYNITRCQLTAQ